MSIANSKQVSFKCLQNVDLVAVSRTLIGRVPRSWSSYGEGLVTETQVSSRYIKITKLQA